MVEKEREKVLRIVVTGGGEGTEAENTEKANHRGHGGHAKKQTTEDTEDTQKKQTTENTEMGREGADTLVRPYNARRVEVECGGVRAGWHSETPYVWRVCGSAGATAGMASLAACSTRIAGVASLAARSTGAWEIRRKGAH